MNAGPCRSFHKDQTQSLNRRRKTIERPHESGSDHAGDMKIPRPVNRPGAAGAGGPLLLIRSSCRSGVADTQPDETSVGEPCTAPPDLVSRTDFSRSATESRRKRLKACSKSSPRGRRLATATDHVDLQVRRYVVLIIFTWIAARATLASTAYPAMNVDRKPLGCNPGSCPAFRRDGPRPVCRHRTMVPPIPRYRR
jgi:hypothetical protein